MLTRLIVRNFKQFDDVDIELGSPVLFIGPNNSGKTTALQALTLWDIGLRKWNEKRKGGPTPKNRPGVTINRRDLMAIPTPTAKLLWRDIHVREGNPQGGKSGTQNIRVEIEVEGVTNDQAWRCGLEFDYANEESFYCRPLRLDDSADGERMPVPDEALGEIAFLPPMSGLAANEKRLDPGAINVLIGEGQTAGVLRNLCYRIAEDQEAPQHWKTLTSRMKKLFGCELSEPRYSPERGEIEMEYIEHNVHFDLSASGRGFQQTLLLLSYMLAYPGAAILLDEPDAHLEILRQRQIYQVLCEVAEENNNQIIAASHSEVLLNEAASQDVVVAFIGKPHRLNDRAAQLRKSLNQIRFEDYAQAAQTGWVLYLEGSTDLSILRALAQRLDHTTAMKALERPFVNYVGNDDRQVPNHFHGLKEALPDLQGFALFDRYQESPPTNLGVNVSAYMWKQRELENYLCFPETLMAYAEAHEPKPTDAGPLFENQVRTERQRCMKQAIEEKEVALAALDKESPWGAEEKVSDEFLEPLFKTYFSLLGIDNMMAKKSFHALAPHVPIELIDDEVGEVLDRMALVHESATS